MGDLEMKRLTEVLPRQCLVELNLEETVVSGTIVS
jgi:hypothetical protein